MIRYTVRCDQGHSFESWFQSAEAFDTLTAARHVACPDCGSTDVAKSLMAPRVRTARKGKAVEPREPAAPTTPVASSPDPEIVNAIKKLRDHVEKNSDYVGKDFVKQARAMHEGEIEHRSIYGEARPDEAKKLAEDGVPALPLPFIPKQKTN